MPTNVLSQSIEPPLRKGEAGTLSITGSFSVDPTSWATAFWLRLHPTSGWTVISAGVTVAVTGSGPFNTTWTVPITADVSSALDAGLNEFQHRRTDDGNETCLAAGTLLILS